MGRQIMADIVRGDTRRSFVTRPDAEAFTMKIPEPYSDNVGPTGVFAVADYVRSRQEMLMHVGRSGDYVPYKNNKGSAFRVKLDYLRDESGNDIIDSASGWMGAETSFAPHFLQCLVQNSTANTYGQAKMIELTKWGDADPDFGYLGLMVVGQRVTGTGIGSLLIYRMEERGPHATEVGYQWESVSHDIPAKGATPAPSADVVEMDDGSIVMVTNLDHLGAGNRTTWRSFDGGDTWEPVSELADATMPEISLERIGSRLVLVTGINTGGNHYVDVRYSDDVGLSWSGFNRIHTDAINQPANPFVDVVMGQDGILYLTFVRNDGANDETLVYSTSDGINWTGPYDTNFANTCTTALQEYYGRWLIYGIVGGEPVRRTREGADLSSSWLVSAKNVAIDTSDTDGMDMLAICARTFASDNFIDLVVTFLDTHSSNRYCIVVYRLSMWSRYKFVAHDFTSSWVFDTCWSAYCYPSTADGHPNLNHWTRVLGGTGASALQSADYGYLRLTSADGASSASYNQGMVADSFDNGFSAQFKLKVVSGFAHVTVRMCSSPSDEDCLFSVVFRQSDNTIILYDHRAAAVAATYTSTNWDLDEWNEYVITAIDSGDGDNLQVNLSRAPFEDYKEIAHYEPVFVAELVTGVAYTADNDNFLWGVDGANPGGNGASDCHWKQVHLNTAFLYTVTSGENVRKCYTGPVGIMEGIAVKWDGSFAVEDDDWDLDVGAQFDADNIFVDSPRVTWADPVNASARSAAASFVWRRADANGNCMNMSFNALAIFGLNCPYLTLYGQQFDGSGNTELLDVDLTNDNLGPTMWQQYFVVSGNPDQQIVRFTAGTSNLDAWPVMSSLASNDFRSWYVVFTTGSQAGCVYRIMDNFDDRLVLEQNVEADGVLDTNRFVIFSDRFMCRLDQRYDYPRVRLDLGLNGLTPSPSENQFRMGTVVLGMLYDLPTDEWESAYRTAPDVNTLRGRGGRQVDSEEGPERRIVDVTYTGNLDGGMGVHIVRELYRSQRWGMFPVVWVDDDLVLDHISGGGAPSHAHVDPILAKVRGPISQNRKAYDYQTWDSISRLRNIMDVTGVSLEEVL